MNAARLLPVLLLAACGEDAPPPPAAPAALQPGLYEVRSEVTGIRAMDDGTPNPILKQGQTATTRVCIAGATATGMPAPALAGLAAQGCQSSGVLFPAGRIAGQLQCRPPKLGGEMNISLNGTHGATDYRLEGDAATVLPTPGDITATLRVAGRRVGDCPAGAAS